ncbi:alanine racemase [Methylobacterium amylolyticum]
MGGLPRAGAAYRRASGDADGYGGLLTIDLGAIARNWRRLSARVAPARASAVVKADAYGLGAHEVAPTLYRAGCRAFFVAHVEEGIKLRAVLPRDAEIIILHGAPARSEPDCDAYQLTPVLNCMEQLTAWIRFTSANGLKRRCVVQFDTGMTRFGFDLSEASSVAAALGMAGSRPSLVMSHLACADDPSAASNAVQRERLLDLRKLFPDTELSLAASSGIFLGPDYHLDLVRPGAALYGVNPAGTDPNPMESTIRLWGRIMQVREVPAGTEVGYGLAGRTKAATRLATVAVGYADGFFRSASGRASAWLGSKRLPLVGRVSMDSIVVDLAALPGPPLVPGDLLDLLGDAYGVDDLAADAGTIGYEILTGLSSRYWREYVE